jgi:hypothetical protein
MAELTTIYPTLLDVARRLDPNGSIAAVAEVLTNYNDILDDIPWTEGNLPTGHQTTIRTSKPTPTFRLLNQGVVPAKSTTGQVVDTCAIIENRSHVDVDLANLGGNAASFRMSEDKGIMQGMSDSLADTLIYGDVSVNPEKFNGLAARYYSLESDDVTTSANVIDAGGSGSDNTSIWLVCWSPDKVFGIYPKGSKAGLQMEDRGIQDILTDSSTNAYMKAYVSWFQWKCGLCIRDWRYVVRIANVDVSDLLTAGDASDTSANIEKKMMQALDKLPPDANIRPVFYMNETVRSMLRVKMYNKSNAYLTLDRDITGQGIARPQGTLKFQGVPCRRIDSILSTESALTAL